MGFIIADFSIIHCQAKKKPHTGPPFALITAHICGGIVAISLCNVTTFIFIQSCIHFSLRSCNNDGTAARSLLQHIPKSLNGDKVWTHVSCATWTNFWQFEPDESCHCRLRIFIDSVHSGSQVTTLCCQLKHSNYCSNFPMESSYLFAYGNPFGGFFFFFWPGGLTGYWMRVLTLSFTQYIFRYN